MEDIFILVKIFYRGEFSLGVVAGRAHNKVVKNVFLLH